MDKKTIIATAAATVVTLITTMGVGWLAGIFERGASALTEDQIVAVIERVLVTDNGNTHAAALAELNGNIIEVRTIVEMTQRDVDKLEQALRELAQ